MESEPGTVGSGVSTGSGLQSGENKIARVALGNAGSLFRKSRSFGLEAELGSKLHRAGIANDADPAFVGTAR
jgi:hypothetical protein